MYVIRLAAVILVPIFLCGCFLDSRINSLKYTESIGSVVSDDVVVDIISMPSAIDFLSNGDINLELFSSVGVSNVNIYTNSSCQILNASARDRQRTTPAPFPTAPADRTRRPAPDGNRSIHCRPAYRPAAARKWRTAPEPCANSRPSTVTSRT